LAKEKGKDSARAVLLQHNETSTGVLNPLKEIAEVVRESGKLLVVDSVSGAGACELEIDEWGIDVCVTASQKAWGAPPGIAMITMSDNAWKAYERSNLPKAYFDLATYKTALEKGATPATPAVSVVIALQESLRLMAEEGLEAILRRHRDIARATRRGLAAVNLSLFADEAHASPAVTSFRPPTRVDARNLIRVLRDDYDTIVAGGQGKLEGQLVRVTTGLKEPDLAPLLRDVDALIVRSETKVTASLMDAAPRLAVIGRAGVGVDNIDVPAATERGVYVVNAPLGNIVAAAEHTIALALALMRKIPEADRSVRAGEWTRSKLIGRELRGKTLGLIGIGRVGSEVARRAA